VQLERVTVRRMARSYTRIPLDVKPEIAEEIDRAIARLMLRTGERLSRTSFIVQAVREKLERLQKEEQSATKGV